MTDCVTCGNRDYLCQQCKMDELERRHGTPADQDCNSWVLDDGLWHASLSHDDGEHTCGCGVAIATPVEWVTENLQHVPDEYDAPVCRECAATLEDSRAETIPDDVQFERASELRADGGDREGELVDRAVREAATLVEAGDSERVAVATVVDEHDLEHRRDDVHERVRDRLNQEAVTDGGQETDSDRFTDLPVPDRFFLQIETVDLDYPVEDWERDEIRFSGQNVPGGKFGFEIAASYTYAGYDCKQHFTLDVDGAVALRTALGEALESKGYDPETGDRDIATDGGVDVDEIRDLIDYWVRSQSTTGGRAIHIPAPESTRDDPVTPCQYAPRSKQFRAYDLEHFGDADLEMYLCSGCAAFADDHTATDDRPAAVPDGGRDLDGRDAFLAGDAHWCDICQTAFTRINDLANHDCRPIRADGGSVSWTGPDEKHASDGMRCHKCDHTHDDWTKDGEYAVDDGHHCGIIERWKCGVCGAITEGGRR